MYDSPGIYRKMIDEPGAVQPQSMNVVGIAVACPNQLYLNEPKLITGGSEELVDLFGNAELGYDGYVAAKIIADMTRVYICNVASQKAGTLKHAEVKLVSTDGQAKDLVTITAKTPGTAGNSLSVVVTGSSAGVFDMRVLGKDNVPLETIKGLSFNKYSLTYVENIASEYITMKALADGTETAVVNAKTYQLAAGTDTTVTAEVAKYVDAVNALNDESLGLSYIVAPTVSYKKEIVAALNSALSETGIIRGIIAPPKSKLTPQDVVDWANGEGKEADTDIQNAVNNSQITVYAPWGVVFDSQIGGEVELSPEIEVLQSEIYTMTNYQPWFAPAGEERGRCKYFLRLLAHYPKSARDVLYGGTNIVNPIAKIGTSGFLIYGQKTSLRDTTKSLTRINVRNLTNYIRKSIEEASKGFVFEQNDQYTWNSWKNLATNFMQQIQDARGVYSFIAKMEPTTTEIDQYVMPAEIAFKPTKTAEYIPITLRLVSAGGTL